MKRSKLDSQFSDQVKKIFTRRLRTKRNSFHKCFCHCYKPLSLFERWAVCDTTTTPSSFSLSLSLSLVFLSVAVLSISFVSFLSMFANRTYRPNVENVFLQAQYKLLTQSNFNCCHNIYIYIYIDNIVVIFSYSYTNIFMFHYNSLCSSDYPVIVFHYAHVRNTIV